MLASTDELAPLPMVPDYEAGLSLLRKVRIRLIADGWVQRRVDELADLSTGTIVRHHYTNGIWELTTTWNDGCTTTQSWNARQDPPSLATVLQIATEHCHSC